VKFRLAVGDDVRSFEAHVRGGTLTLVDERGQTHDVRLLRREGARLTLQFEHETVHVWGTRSGGHGHVWTAGRLLRYTRVEERASHETQDPGVLCVAIPAVVTEVLVDVGDAVEAGDRLVLLESMKMVLSIRAPQAGVVKGVLCQNGQSVDPGVALVEVEFS